MPLRKTTNERVAIMETVSQRLQETTDRLGEVADSLRTNIAVHEVRLKNQDRIIDEIRTEARNHQRDDQASHQQMNDKLDSINSKLDIMKGKEDAGSMATEVSSFASKIGELFAKWKYAIWGAVFAAGVLTHKAHFFEWVLRMV